VQSPQKNGQIPHEFLHHIDWVRFQIRNPGNPPVP